MEWTVLPQPAHSPDLAASDCHLFGRVKDALRGRHFSDDRKLKQSFRDVLPSWGKKFYNSDKQRLTQRWQKCVENEVDFVEEWPHNSKNVWIIHVNLIVIEIIFYEKKLEALPSYRPS
jgi:hypothetical protein